MIHSDADKAVCTSSISNRETSIIMESLEKSSEVNKIQYLGVWLEKRSIAEATFVGLLTSLNFLGKMKFVA